MMLGEQGDEGGRRPGEPTATIFLHAVISRKTSLTGSNVVQSLHPSSATSDSNSGPRNSSAVSNRAFRASARPTGQYPRAWSAAPKLCPPTRVRTARVVRETATQVRVTEVIRARMTCGASRLRVGEGRVFGDR